MHFLDYSLSEVFDEVLAKRKVKRLYICFYIAENYLYRWVVIEVHLYIQNRQRKKRLCSLIIHSTVISKFSSEDPSPLDGLGKSAFIIFVRGWFGGGKFTHSHQLHDSVVRNG